jgi:hypothetical protein
MGEDNADDLSTSKYRQGAYIADNTAITYEIGTYGIYLK